MLRQQSPSREDVTRTLEVVPRHWKVIETFREKFSCRDCEKISQAAAPFHAIARLGWPEPPGDDHVREVRSASAAQPHVIRLDYRRSTVWKSNSCWGGPPMSDDSNLACEFDEPRP